MVLIDSAGLAVSKGTGLAIDTAKKLGKPNIVIDMDADGAGVLAMGFIGEGRGLMPSASPGRAKAKPPASTPRRTPSSAACSARGKRHRRLLYYHRASGSPR